MDGLDGELFSRRGFGKWLAGDRRSKAAHELEQSGAARIDDTRLSEDVELLLRLGDGRLTAPDERLEQIGGGVGGTALRFLGECADHGQHRSLDRLVDAAVGLVACLPERAGDRVGVDRVGLTEDVGGATDDLREDHAGVPACAEQRRAGHLAGELFAIGGRGGVERLDDPADGHGEVRAGVAVGHRVDVEVIDPLPALLERGRGGPYELAESVEIRSCSQVGRDCHPSAPFPSHTRAYFLVRLAAGRRSAVP